MKLTLFKTKALQHVIYTSVPIYVTELYRLLTSFYQSSIESHVFTYFYKYIAEKNDLQNKYITG